MASSASKWNYDVFISFRGADVRDGFLSHLFHALCQKQIITFKDENLERGEEISPSLFRVIEESSVALVIFSRNYANSPWCLDELVKIVDCKKKMGQIVIPVFYHVDPTDVQELTGCFGEAFKGLPREEFKGKWENWSCALRETAEISGFDSRNLKPETELIKEIVYVIHERVNHVFSYIDINDGLIGMDSRVNAIKSKLCVGSKDVRFLGIWGMGGIGKTTLARKVYDQISFEFESTYFVGNVREKLEKYTLDDLQYEIHSELLGGEISNLGRSNLVASSFIRKWMKQKNVLVVLDDVFDLKQIEFLVGKHEMYGPGSRVIMTCRDKQILVNAGADEIYEAENLNYSEAFQLLSLHAFKQNSPSEGYKNLANKVLGYAEGNPLALKVLGSTLHNKSIGEWEDQLDKLEAMADHKIQIILKISYDELDYMEKEIFLDIACFFKGEDRDHAECVLQGCGLNAKIGIGILHDKALITISQNKLYMHALLQHMGREIVRKECIEKPWNCSRLWVAQDIFKILTKDLGEVSVKSIILDISKAGDINLSSTVFTRMKMLRLLKFYNPYYPDEKATDSQNGVIKIQQARYHFWKQHAGLVSLPDELRYLYWHGYPSDSLPLQFSPKNLVQLHLVHSHVKELCNKKQRFENLRLMDLSYSVKLIKIADLSKFPKLEVLCLRGCISLVEIRSTKLYDSELRHLNLESCKSLCDFSSFLRMERLDFLSLKDCSKLTEFPKIPRSLKCLILSKTAVKQVPPSIQFCSQLTELKLESCSSLCVLPSNIGELQLLECLKLKGCSKLMHLPESTCNLMSLKYLIIKECQNLKKLPENIGNLNSLEKLDASKSGVTLLPSSINRLMKLDFLSCRGCRDLILPPFTGLPSLKKLLLDDCDLWEIPESIGSLKSLFGLYLDGNNLKKLPTSIKQLSELKRLYLRDNRRLEYIPELPASLAYISVQNCYRLESLSSFTEVNMKFLHLLDARNCTNLDKTWREKLMDDLLLEIENVLPQWRYMHKHSYEIDEVFTEDVRVFNLSTFCIVGNELQPGMKHKNINGSDIFISMEPAPLDFLVVIFSAIVAPKDTPTETAIQFGELGPFFDIEGNFVPEFVIKCDSCFVTDSGLSFNNCRYCADFGDMYCKPNLPMVLENNLLWVYQFHFKDKHRFTEASFRFSSDSDDLTVKKCGVHLLYCSGDDDVRPGCAPFVGYSSHYTNFVSLT